MAKSHSNNLSIWHRPAAVYMVAPVLIFFFAFILRLFFFSGFILGDDIQEFATCRYVMENGPSLNDQFHLRFGCWIFNVLAFNIFGISEFSFFLPTIFMSSSMGCVGYLLFLFKKYKFHRCVFGGLFIASAPFEILIGGVRANDIILSWFLALTILLIIILENKPILQGILIGFILWVSFYVKLWVVYVFPFLGVYYLFKSLKSKRIRGFLTFIITSLMLHAMTCLLWKIQIGKFLPFLSNHAATYPVPRKELSHLFLVYPKQIFCGSEFGTTFFGHIPYLLFFLLLIKLVMFVFEPENQGYKLDTKDIWLFGYYISFFLLLNFFPNSFKFDQYYSAPRIFRYLAPLSFPMTLHLAKIIIEFTDAEIMNVKPVGIVFFSKAVPILIFSILLLTNILLANIATKEGRLYRQTFLAVISDIKNHPPPKLLAESWMSFFLRELYLKEYADRIVSLFNIHSAADYELWLDRNQNQLPDQTMLITGLGSYVHYGAHYNGFRLNLFSKPLNSAWSLYRQYKIQSYLSNSEQARLWILSNQIHD